MPAPWWQVYAFGLVLLPFPQVGVLVKRRDADELSWLSVLGNIRVYHRHSLTGGKNQTEVPEGWWWSLRLIWKLTPHHSSPPPPWLRFPRFQLLMVSVSPQTLNCKFQK